MGYVTQKLRSACEFLISSLPMKERLRHAHVQLLQLTLLNHHEQEPFAKELRRIFAALETLDSLDSESQQELAQEIFDLFEKSILHEK